MATADEHNDLPPDDEDEDTLVTRQEPDTDVTAHPGEDSLDLSDDTEPVLLLDEGALDEVLPELKAPFVGRQAPLAQLVGFFRAAADGDTLSFVTVVGQPGTGKSRLVQELARAVRSDVPEARVLSGAADGRAGPPYGAMVQALAQRFGALKTDSDEVLQNKISAGVEEAIDRGPLSTEVTHLLAQLMGAPFADSPVVEPLIPVPRQLEVRTFIAVRRFLERDCRGRPLLLIFDDIHRAGSETVNLIHYLAAGLSNCPVMLLGTALPALFDRYGHWGQGTSEHQRVELSALGAEDAVALFKGLVRLSDLPEALLAVSRERLDGCPRAICEFARFLVESGVIATERSPWSLRSERLAFTPLPHDHKEIIRARLQALPPGERAVLEMAAVVG